MIGTINRAENNLFCDPPRVLTLAAGVAQEIFPSEQGLATGEIAYRYVQNVGANELYYSFGITDENDPSAAKCDTAVLFHGKLSAGAQLDCSNHRLRVCAVSTAGTTVSTTMIRRRDLR